MSKRKVLIAATLDGATVTRVHPDTAIDLPDGPWWVVGEGQAVIDGNIGTVQRLPEWWSTDNPNPVAETFIFVPLVPPAPPTIREALANEFDPTGIGIICDLLDLDPDGPLPTQEVKP